MKENLEQPGAAIGSRLKTVKRSPRLKIDFLNQIFGARTVAHHSKGGSKDIIQIPHCLRFQQPGGHLLDVKFWLLGVSKFESAVSINRCRASPVLFPQCRNSSTLSSYNGLTGSLRGIL
jgi:hypothetical protein